MSATRAAQQAGNDDIDDIDIDDMDEESSDAASDEVLARNPVLNLGSPATGSGGPPAGGSGRDSQALQKQVLDEMPAAPAAGPIAVQPVALPVALPSPRPTALPLGPGPTAAPMGALPLGPGPTAAPIGAMSVEAAAVPTREKSGVYRSPQTPPHSPRTNSKEKRRPEKAKKTSASSRRPSFQSTASKPTASKAIVKPVEDQLQTQGIPEDVKITIGSPSAGCMGEPRTSPTSDGKSFGSFASSMKMNDQKSKNLLTEDDWSANDDRTMHGGRPKRGFLESLGVAILGKSIESEAVDIGASRKGAEIARDYLTPSKNCTKMGADYWEVPTTGLSSFDKCADQFCKQAKEFETCTCALAELEMWNALKDFLEQTVPVHELSTTKEPPEKISLQNLILRSQLALPWIIFAFFGLASPMIGLIIGLSVIDHSEQLRMDQEGPLMFSLSSSVSLFIAFTIQWALRAVAERRAAVVSWQKNLPQLDQITSMTRNCFIDSLKKALSLIKKDAGDLAKLTQYIGAAGESIQHVEDYFAEAEAQGYTVKPIEESALQIERKAKDTFRTTAATEAELARCREVLTSCGSDRIKNDLKWETMLHRASKMVFGRAYTWRVVVVFPPIVALGALLAIIASVVTTTEELHCLRGAADMEWTRRGINESEKVTLPGGFGVNDLVYATRPIKLSESDGPCCFPCEVGTVYGYAEPSSTGTPRVAVVWKYRHDKTVDSADVAVTWIFTTSVRKAEYVSLFDRVAPYWKPPLIMVLIYLIFSFCQFLGTLVLRFILDKLKEADYGDDAFFRGFGVAARVSPHGSSDAFMELFEFRVAHSANMLLQDATFEAIQMRKAFENSQSQIKVLLVDRHKTLKLLAEQVKRKRAKGNTRTNGQYVLDDGVDTNSR
jgi:hypothetical protein